MMIFIAMFIFTQLRIIVRTGMFRCFYLYVFDVLYLTKSKLRKLGAFKIKEACKFCFKITPLQIFCFCVMCMLVRTVAIIWISTWHYY